MTPFIIYALPRSRTAWLSKFLTYGDWECYHEAAMYMRSMEDVTEFFSQSNIGTAETAVAQGHNLIKHFVPDLKEVVVLRPVEQVIDSLRKIDITGFSWDCQRMQKLMEYGDRELHKIAKNKDVLVIEYDDLKNEETCARIFEHCLPYKFDKNWWKYWDSQNIQVDTKNLLHYRTSHRKEIDDFKVYCKRILRDLCRTGELRRI